MKDTDIYAPQWVIEEVCKMNLSDIFNGMVRKPREYDLYPKKNYGDIKCLAADMSKLESSNTK